MITKDSEARYEVVVNYNADEVIVYAARGKIIARQTTLIKPSFLDKLLGATMEKRIRKASHAMQTLCDELNTRLEEMDAACKAAERSTGDPLF